MLFFKSILSVTALAAVASAFAVERSDLAQDIQAPEGIFESIKSSVFALTSSCEKSDLSDCSDFCAGFDEKAICSAQDDKVTCRCKPEEKNDPSVCKNCLICMDSVSSLFDTESKAEELK